MQTITTIGLDIAKSVFHVHGVDWWPSGYSPRVEAALRPGVPPEANAMSGRYRSPLVAPLVARAPGIGSRLMPSAYVKPYVKRQKNDATDAEAICKAVTRVNIRFVPAKTPEQQSGLVVATLVCHPLFYTRSCGCNGRPAFPAPAVGRKVQPNLRRIAPRGR
jgi:transposase